MLRSCSLTELLDMGLTITDITRRLSEIDQENGLIDDNGQIIERATRFYEETDYLWRVVMDDSQIVGYWSFCILNRGIMARVAAGQFSEQDVSHLTLKIDPCSGINSLFFDCVSLSKSHQGKHLSGYLLKSMYTTLAQLPESGIYIDQVWASVWTAAGMRFCEKLGFKHHLSNQHKGEICKVSFSLLLRRLEELNLTYGL
ncbi:MAG: hypothetical protein FWE76_00975 [Symbiobacteriaceae bacterium]|nr:hypothetical protein [Symbiobacteriaceae bacterium]